MTNEQKFKTPEERIDAFKRYCAQRVCDDCQAYKIHHCPDGRMGCIVRWLSLEAEEELLPCPFCGGDAVVVVTHPISQGAYVRCKECRVLSMPCNTKAEAIAAWNRRAE